MNAYSKRSAQGAPGVGAASYLPGFSRRAALRDGSPVRIRAIRPDDKERLQIAFGRLSSRSVYQRFFHAVAELTSDDLRRLTEIDFHDHVGLVLTVGDETDERLIAIGRFVRAEDRVDRAEVAFTVADEYQRRGAATLLLRQLAALAKERGIREFVALVLDDNRQMLEVIENSKLPFRATFTDGVRCIVVSLEARGVPDRMPDAQTRPMPSGRLRRRQRRSCK